MEGDSQATPQSVLGWRVVLSVVWNKLSKDNMTLRASALAYSTLASLVPIFAIILAVLSGPAYLESRELVMDQLAAGMVPAEGPWGWQNPQPSQTQFKQTFRETIGPLAEKAGAVSVFGFIILVATLGLLFLAVEDSFNVIWRVTSRRTFILRAAIATSMIFWGPVMLAVSISLGHWLQNIPLLGTYVVPVLFSAAGFTIFFMIMPNATVAYRAALAGGLAAAIVWEIAKLGFLLYATRVVSYSKVYGSLGLIPMLFLWVYINWLIILAGAELAYCLQHRAAMVEEWVKQNPLELKIKS